MNQIILLGTIKEEPLIKQTNNGLSVGNLILEVEKPYQNNEGEIEKDLISVVLWRSMADNAKEYAKKGMHVAIKAHLNANNYIKEDGNVMYRADIVVDKLTYIS